MAASMGRTCFNSIDFNPRKFAEIGKKNRVFGSFIREGTKTVFLIFWNFSFIMRGAFERKEKKYF